MIVSWGKGVIEGYYMFDVVVIYNDIVLDLVGIVFVDECFKCVLYECVSGVGVG